MAHANIETRRQAVIDALTKLGTLSPTDRRRLAEQFDCTSAAIWADVLTIQNGGVNHVSKSIKEKVLQRDGNICYICGEPTNYPIIEHKTPARAGGKATLDNLAVACHSCNMKKVQADKILFPY